MKKLIILFVLIFSLRLLSAQEKLYQLTVAGGPAVSLFFNHVKLPGFTLKLIGEKQFSFDESRYFMLALEYSRFGGAKPATVLYDATGPSYATDSYHASDMLTLTFGGRKYTENKLVFGAAMGLGIMGQGATNRFYNNPLIDYTGPQSTKYGLWGIGSSAQIGYKPGNLQVMITYHGVLDVFRTIDMSDRAARETSSFAGSFSLTAGYTF
jgi:hypothetical protein